MSDDVEHTSGPWRLPNSGDSAVLRDYGVVLVDLPQAEEAAIVAEANQAFNDDTALPGHYEANARLIAAAPELLEALKELETWWSNWMPDNAWEQGGGEALEKARDAIAKAEGRHE